MKKPESLKALLLASVPGLADKPENLSMFIDKGRIAARLTGSLSFEYRYTVNVVVQDFAGDVDALFVPLLFLMRRAPDLVLSLSVTLYTLVQVFGFNIPTWPKGEWFFNPFAWQVLVVFGAWIAFGGARKIGGFVASRAVLAGAVAYVVASLIIALGWKFEPLRVVVPQVIADMIYPVDKSSLSPLRLAHFLALAIIAMRFMPQNWPGLSTPPLNFLVRSGQNSLAIYAIGVVLSFIASQVLPALGGGLGVQAFVSLTGIAAIAVLADILTRLGKLSGHRPKLF
jgi:hypothetical protein